MKLKDLIEKVEALWDPLGDAMELSECQIVMLDLAKETLNLVEACGKHDPMEVDVAYLAFINKLESM